MLRCFRLPDRRGQGGFAAVVVACGDLPFCGTQVDYTEAVEEALGRRENHLSRWQEVTSGSDAASSYVGSFARSASATSAFWAPRHRGVNELHPLSPLLEG